MPHRASATKALRQGKKRQQCNKPVKSRLTTETRSFERAVERGDAKAAQGQLNLLTKLLQRAAIKGIIKANTAARRQARFQKQLNGITAAKG
jgi:ribosomal protein S20